ncbi:hypothetical protein TAMA11512_21690 [Selenomonas sp. TAMA-11512]|uniref:pentapeptide repeat-containing protein n=1 Tax=Selenomonas sp. TAMA-11512 TaxID=3095337 RepID=UPI00308E4B1E|nr:hypothetical protein TAMA11512_08910 [Selenomonas sp. TAMA-11512]BEU88705.1 hypothetical protein TAMA11512_21690 [Selenomonas sp. TAMA-11512]
MNKEKLKEIIKSHGRWLKGESDGQRADLRGADLRDADLCDADLRGADLRDADLCDADLRGADLRDADLRDADLCGANLCGANLCLADLRGANLCGANLCWADLRGAVMSVNIIQVGPIGSRRSYTTYNVTEDIVQCGFWNHYRGGTLAEFEARVEELYPAEKGGTFKYRKEYLAVIAYFKAMREMEGQK